MKKRRWIYPVFLPNMGCPHRCAFCDQHAVTGEVTGLPPLEALEADFPSTGGGDREVVRQIAFYGGSFTALPLSVQKRYLDWAAAKVRQGLVDSLRCSTRPDALSDDELAFLSDYPIQTVEIGVQSLDDGVLAAIGRGHTAKDAEVAVEKVLAKGWEAGVQLMPGLPGETLKGFLRGVSAVAGWGVRDARLYPVVALEGTRLAMAYRRGRYRPLSLKEAVLWCARASEILEESGVTVIRVGLPDSDLLRRSIVAGPYHPAFGFLVQSFRFHQRLQSALCRASSSARAVRIHLSPRDVPLLMGDRGQAWKTLLAAYPGMDFRYEVDSGLSKGDVKLEVSTPPVA